MPSELEKNRQPVYNGHYSDNTHLVKRSKAHSSSEEPCLQPARSSSAAVPTCLATSLRRALTMRRCLAMFVLLAVAAVMLCRCSASAQLDPTNYAIIFDAGSTGSRIHIFTFRNTSALGQVTAGPDLELMDEYYYEEVKPGLSSYADNPLRAAFSLTPLLRAALQRVPQELWVRTPLLLRATAGLRLLSDASAAALLAEVELLFRQYPFQLLPGSVAMMSGEDEGICGWITVNFLLGTIRDSEKSVATLDLGGGSTQVTLLPSCAQTFKIPPPGFLVFRHYLDSSFTIYTHSYLGLGLMATRHAILSYSSRQLDYTFSNQTKLLESPCIHPQVRQTWLYGLDQYLITSQGGYNAERCQRLVSAHVASFRVDRPCELQTHGLVAVSYYYDRAVDLGLLRPDQMIAKVKISDYQAAAKSACEAPQPEHHPMLCLDGTFIVTLLTEGFGLSPDTTITVSKKIKGVETSWGLGAGLQAIYHNL